MEKLIKTMNDLEDLIEIIEILDDKDSKLTVEMLKRSLFVVQNEIRNKLIEMGV